MHEILSEKITGHNNSSSQTIIKPRYTAMVNNLSLVFLLMLILFLLFKFKRGSIFEQCLVEGNSTVNDELPLAI